jgi:hypothetical protein
MYPHLRYKNVEIASVDVEKKVLSLIVHYDGNENDLMKGATRVKLNLDIATAIAHFKNQRYFEDDNLSGWKSFAAIIVHPTIKHE